MKRYAAKIGAVFYVLWGLLHIVGAAVLLQQASGGAAAALAAVGSAAPEAAIPQVASGLLTSVLSYYAWNLLWVGILVAVVGVTLNWQNSILGFWLNLAVVSAVDLGLIIFLIAPGHMALADGMLGVLLWIPAVVFSAIGLLAGRRQPVKQAAPA